MQTQIIIIVSQTYVNHGLGLLIISTPIQIIADAAPLSPPIILPPSYSPQWS
ncbi:hypothetical protein HYDPIDRAFT_31676 [Hydnomerulius pinastri MD-312]|uniref:Uncharacterized protein n=1 Tax=Hydnomerulius pinastri MD-312 TaxID=994086 RepID=A0A0C9WBG8_9AGAM|nr:hypothetical protein HYDPIDRAFT_31676 [Hydnomerulius pinastri MD-312]